LVDRSSPTLARVDVVAAKRHEYLAATFADGGIILRPLSWYPTLADATASQRNNWRLIADGHGVHWPDLDLDLSADSLLVGRPDMTKRSAPRLPLDATLAALLARLAPSAAQRREPLAQTLRAHLSASQFAKLVSDLGQASAKSPRSATKRSSRRRRTA
jgi:hypothetical protein